MAGDGHDRLPRPRFAPERLGRGRTLGERRAMSFLELTDVQKRFGSTVAVESFNLAAEQGEFVSFLGPSGCGKTTTLRMIAGFEQPSGGSITINGRDVTYMPPNKRDVGMVFQSYALFPNM